MTKETPKKPVNLKFKVTKDDKENLAALAANHAYADRIEHTKTTCKATGEIVYRAYVSVTQEKIMKSLPEKFFPYQGYFNVSIPQGPTLWLEMDHRKPIPQFFTSLGGRGIRLEPDTKACKAAIEYHEYKQETERLIDDLCRTILGLIHNCRTLKAVLEIIPDLEAIVPDSMRGVTLALVDPKALSKVADAMKKAPKAGFPGKAA